MPGIRGARGRGGRGRGKFPTRGRGWARVRGRGKWAPASRPQHGVSRTSLLEYASQVPRRLPDEPNRVITREELEKAMGELMLEVRVRRRRRRVERPLVVNYRFGGVPGMLLAAIDYECEDVLFTLSASCLMISNPDWLSISKLGVNSEIKG
jgi:hypothetical protein